MRLQTLYLESDGLHYFAKPGLCSPATFGDQTSFELNLKLISSIYHFCVFKIEFFERSSVVRGNKETFSFEFLGHSFQKCLVHQS